MEEEDPVPNGMSLFTSQAWNNPINSSIKSLWDWYEPGNVPHRIAIVGAGNTGKKALAKRLADKLEIPCISSVPRTVNKLGYGLNSNADIKSEMMIWLAQLWEQSEYDEFVSASSLFEVVAHTHWLMSEGQFEDPFFVRAITNMTWTVVQNDYSVFFYLPYDADKHIRRDGIRSRSKKYNVEIDALIKYYLDACEVDYLPVEGTTDEQYAICVNYMKDYGLIEQG